MRKSHSQEFVENYHREHEYTLNSIYINNRIKNNLTCSNNHNCFIAFDKFQQGRRCAKCSNKKEKLTHEFVFNYYSKENYTMHNIYNTCGHKDKLTCPKGHKWSTNFDNFKSKNNRCFTCHCENNRGKNNPNYKKDRTRRKRTAYLQFDLSKLNILKDDPLYDNYIQSQTDAKESENIYEKTKYTVDHIQPRIAFVDNNLDKIYGEPLIKKICNSRENLRIISRKNNGSKGGKYNQEQFLEWFNKKISGYSIHLNKIY